MNITSIEIENYRSIQKTEIKLSEINGKKASILIGLNESGKSNVLKAINLLDKSSKLDYSTDSNKELKKTEDAISVTFTLGLKSIQMLKDKLNEDGVDKALLDNLTITQIDRIVEFDEESKRIDYCHIYTEIDEIHFEKYFIHKTFGTITLKSKVYSGGKITEESKIPSILGAGYTQATQEKFEDLLEKKYFKIIDTNMPKIIFWRAGEKKYLINEPIDLKVFKDDFETSLPLKNIFHIAKVSDIQKRLSLIEKDSEERQELEELLSGAITTYINQVWKEHKININVRIEEGMKCTVSVEDKDNKKPKFKMGQRSDGFKQFISILLNLSAENEAKNLKNTIIILDEPEVHLHPSGVKYLRDELLKISENNQVVIATHSIYMVDKLNLNRHFQVTKDKSVTKILQIEPDNPYQEEVIYEALGTSIFEHISPHMLVLEGKTDKDIFDAFTNKFKSEIKPLNLGTISADGVENISKYVKFFDGKLVKGFVLVDSDKDGLKVKETVIRENSQFSKANAFDINTIKSILDECTLEDMFPIRLVTESVEKVYKVSLELDKNKPCMKQIKQKLREKRIFDSKDNLRKLKSEVTNRVLEYLKEKSSTQAKVKEEYPLYYDFLMNLHTNMKAVNVTPPPQQPPAQP